ncbi:MAG: DUF2244 domain-containing protein [Dinoroseobacter sp.]|nr:DUF2244 domain-containing protein [Dinoroseobacter sp.]MDJ0992431.1 DUF2244 domain-containing protein [Dinoroseobacter sp.]
MPIEWSETMQEAPEKSGAFSPVAVLRLWPHRSLTAKGFVWFIGITATALSLPLIAVLGSVVLWGLLPFMLLALAGVWYGIVRNQTDLSLNEVLELSAERIALTRHNPRQSDQHWEANPYWVELTLHPSQGPVENYLTLRGSDREVELGAFLSPEERIMLYADLQDRLNALRR